MWDLDQSVFLSDCRRKLKIYAHGLLGKAQSRAATSDVVQNAMIQVAACEQDLRKRSEAQRDAWLKTIAVGHASKVRRTHDAQCRDIAREDPRFVNPMDSSWEPVEVSAENGERFVQLHQLIQSHLTKTSSSLSLLASLENSRTEQLATSWAAPQRYASGSKSSRSPSSLRYLRQKVLPLAAKSQATEYRRATL